MTKKRIVCSPGDRATRALMLAAHQAGRHGSGSAPGDVLAYWAEVCLDCHARWRYEHA